MKNTTTLHNIYNPNQSKDIADDVFDWCNCFEFEELKTSVNDNNIDDDYNNVMLWFADNIEVVNVNNDFIICKISQFIDNNREIFDEFLNQVYKPEYQPQNNDKIESESEEFYDYYLDEVFGGLINGTFSTDDYSILWRLICDKNASKSALITNLAESKQLSQQIDVLDYAKFLVSKKQESACDMVKNCPQNIYINDWKREEKMLKQKSAILEGLSAEMWHKLQELGKECEQLKKDTRQIIANYIISHLSSAYQENAIDGAFYDFIDGDISTSQEFADACCEYYRQQLKDAGFEGNKVYKAFEKYGDETQVQSVAFVIFGIIAR